MAWEIRMCKRCGRPLWAELVLPPKGKRVYQNLKEAKKKDPHAMVVIVEELPDIEIDEVYSIPEIRFFRKLDWCPLYPGKKCEA